jgi:hypothetical protein
MDVSQVLICVILGPIGLALLSRCVWTMSKIIWRASRIKILRMLILPRLFPGWHPYNPPRIELMLYAIHWIITGFFNGYGIESLSQAGMRAGVIATVHLVPLLATSQLDFAAHLFGIGPQSFRRVHQAFGLMAAAQSVFHSIVHARSLSPLNDTSINMLIVSFIKNNNTW